MYLVLLARKRLNSSVSLLLAIRSHLRGEKVMGQIDDTVGEFM
jgi:hypothetical protein